MLAVKIRSNNNIKGLEIHGLIKTKVSLYADDTCFLLKPQLESSLIEDLDTFAILSGLKPNYDKCTILCIGSQKMQILHYHVVYQLNGITEMWTYSVYKSQKKNDLTPIIFYRKLAKIDKILLPWKGKYLSICGKITLINSLVISQFTYLLMVLPTPSDLLFKLYEQKILNFIWNGKPDKIKRAYLYNEYEFGGQK